MLQHRNQSKKNMTAIGLSPYFFKGLGKIKEKEKKKRKD